MENELDPADIKAAEVVILAIDIAITGMERFKGKKVVKIDTGTLIRNPIADVYKRQLSNAAAGECVRGAVGDPERRNAVVSHDGRSAGSA